MIKLFYIALCLLLITCSQKEDSSEMFKSYKTNDSHFTLFRDTTITDRYGNQYIKFKLSMVDDWKSVIGYLKINDTALHYMNEKQDVYKIGDFKSLNQTLITSFSYYIKDKISGAKSMYYTDDLIVKNYGRLVTGNDTIYRLLIYNFNLLRKEDNLMLYVSKDRGIVGSAAFLNDSSIFFYQGQIYADTNLTLSKRTKILE